MKSPKWRNHQVMRESVVTCCDRVCVVNTQSAATASSRGGKGQPFPEALAQQLRDQKSSMSLVQVPHSRSNTQRAQGACAANSQDHLLPDPGGLIAAIEPVSDVAIRRVLRQLVSSRYTGTRPTWAFQSRETTSRPAIRTVT